MPRSVLRLILVLHACLFGVAAGAQERAGLSELVRVWANRVSPTNGSGPLFEREAVFAREILSTVERGALHLRLADGTEVRLGSAATLVLDDFVYRRGAEDRAVISVSRGIARFVTGRMRREGFQVTTPVASVGVRGTDFSVWVEASGRTTIWVNDGVVQVTPLGVAPELVQRDETVVVEAVGQPLQRNAVRPAADPGLRSRTEILFP